MRRFLITLSVITGLFFSCKTSEPTIVKVGNESIKTNEFKYVYEKNHAKDHDRYSKESLDNYLELFINYRLKVLEAEEQKLDSTPAFNTELNGYKKQLAKPYFADDLMTEKLAKEAYDRSKTAIRARHILIKVEETASPADTAYAYDRLKVIKESISTENTFGDIAYEYSQDPSAQGAPGKPGYKGDLGYFSSLRMVYEFENAAFNTPKGQISNIIRTKFGYHILEVEEVHTMDYQVKVAHIMIKASNGLPEADSLEKKNLADLVYNSLKEGQNWDSLCTQYSDHTKTKDNGGNLPPFTLGGSLGLPQFELASYELKDTGNISTPIKTPYGWHIIKLVEKVHFPAYEEVIEDYIAKVKRDARSQQNKTALIAKLKSENNFQESSNKEHLLKVLADSALTLKDWNIENHSGNLEEKLFSINKKNYKVYDFGQFIESNQKQAKKGAKEYMINSLYTDFVSNSLIEYEEGQLEDKHFDYKMLVQEFHDGILIYDLMKMEVWDKANQDTSGLRAFFNENISNYPTKDRIKGSVYTVKEIQTLPFIKKDLERGISSDSILRKYNTNEKSIVSVEKGAFEKGDNKILDAIQWDLSNKVEMYEVEGVDYLVVKDDLRVNAFHTLEEVRGRVVADYQKELETNFIKELKVKYPVEVIELEYNSLIKY